jgi:hypothetical protein
MDNIEIELAAFCKYAGLTCIDADIIDLLRLIHKCILARDVILNFQFWIAQLKKLQVRKFWIYFM